MVEVLFDLFFDDVFEYFQVDQVVCYRVYFFVYFDFQFVIMAMVVGVIVQFEDFLIFFIVLVGIVQLVGGIEMGVMENSYFYV